MVASPRSATSVRAPGGGALPALAVALPVAALAFGATFRGPRSRFWHRMTLTGAGLGSLALVASPSVRRVRVRPRDVLLGLSSATVLYATFAVGDRVVRRVLPGGDEQIREVYALRDLRTRREIAVRLVTLIGPAEELFWRGLVQGTLTGRLGRWRGAIVATAAYAGVHVVSGNVTLVGAAAVGGAHWGGLYAAGFPLGALVVSHVAWDVWIFLLGPTTPEAAGERRMQPTPDSRC